MRCTDNKISATHRLIRQIRNLDIGQKKSDVIERLLVWREG